MQGANGAVTGLKIYQTELPQLFTVAELGAGIVPGTVVTDGKSVFKVATQDGWVLLRELQLNGKKRMKVADFLRGLHHADELKMI
jgi:methionyl-tRNA formyltransferase